MRRGGCFGWVRRRWRGGSPARRRSCAPSSSRGDAGKCGRTKRSQKCSGYSASGGREGPAGGAGSVRELLGELAYNAGGGGTLMITITFPDRETEKRAL